MIQHVSPLHLRQKLGDVLNRVALRQDEYVIERKGHALAALVSVEKMRSLVEAARLHLLAALPARRTKLTQVAADALADEAKHRSRPKRKK